MYRPRPADPDEIGTFITEVRRGGQPRAACVQAPTAQAGEQGLRVSALGSSPDFTNSQPYDLWHIGVTSGLVFFLLHETLNS